MANSEVECVELIETAQRRSVVLMVAYCMRYHPLSPASKKRLTHALQANYFNFLFGLNSIQSVHRFMDVPR